MTVLGSCFCLWEFKQLSGPVLAPQQSVRLIKTLIFGGQGHYHPPWHQQATPELCTTILRATCYSHYLYSHYIKYQNLPKFTSLFLHQAPLWLLQESDSTLKLLILMIFANSIIVLVGRPSPGTSYSTIFHDITMSWIFEH